MLTDHASLAPHEVARLLPAMEEADYVRLVEDIRARGLIEPIWLHEGRIIDGRHRYRACLDASVEPRFRTWDGTGNLVDFVLSLNVERRHLTPAQRAVIAVEVLPLYEAEAKWRQKELAGTRRKAGAADLGAIVHQGAQEAPMPAPRAPKASEQAAQKMHVSARYVAATKRIKERAPAVLEEMRRGILTVPEATKLTQMSAESRALIVDKLQTGEAATLRKAQDIVALERQKARGAALAARAVPLQEFLGLPSSPMPRVSQRVSRTPCEALDMIARTYLHRGSAQLCDAILGTIHEYVTKHPDTDWQTVWDHFQEAADVLHQERRTVRLVEAAAAGDGG